MVSTQIWGGGGGEAWARSRAAPRVDALRRALRRQPPGRPRPHAGMPQGPAAAPAGPCPPSPPLPPPPPLPSPLPLRPLYRGARHVLHARRNVERHVGRAAAGAPRDVAERGAVRRHAVEALKQVVDALRGEGGDNGGPRSQACSQQRVGTRPVGGARPGGRAPGPRRAYAAVGASCIECSTRGGRLGPGRAPRAGALASSVLGGKNSKLKKGSPFSSFSLILSMIFMLGASRRSAQGASCGCAIAVSDDGLVRNKRMRPVAGAERGATRGDRPISAHLAHLLAKGRHSHTATFAPRFDLLTLRDLRHPNHGPSEAADEQAPRGRGRDSGQPGQGAERAVGGGDGARPGCWSAAQRRGAPACCMAARRGSSSLRRERPGVAARRQAAISPCESAGRLLRVCNRALRTLHHPPTHPKTPPRRAPQVRYLLTVALAAAFWMVMQSILKHSGHALPSA
jgi:hypothetical protein